MGTDVKSAPRKCKTGEDLWYCRIKRLCDVGGALVGGIVLMPVMLLIALAVKLDSPGPALFRQERLGKNGRPFILYKFRSMVVDAERNGPCWAEHDDVRCTRVGHFLRRSHLDELPQLWNILRGEMSFVGPRPERAYFYHLLEGEIPDFALRMQVVPGLTGLAQVSGGFSRDPRKKLAFDLYYINRHSLWLDFRCLVKTVLVALRIPLEQEGISCQTIPS